MDLIGGSNDLIWTWGPQAWANMLPLEVVPMFTGCLSLLYRVTMERRDLRDLLARMVQEWVINTFVCTILISVQQDGHWLNITLFSTTSSSSHPPCSVFSLQGLSGPIGPPGPAGPNGAKVRITLNSEGLNLGLGQYGAFLFYVDLWVWLWVPFPPRAKPDPLDHPVLLVHVALL